MRLLFFVLYAAQAALLLARLDLLDPWGDEVFTLEVTALPFGAMLQRLNADIHPPLYFVLQQVWQQAPVPWSDLAQVRLFSALFALAATAVLDRLFLQETQPATRAWALALWCLSPCLLLYGRMARSYSLQVMLALCVFAAARACRAKPERRSPWLWLAGTLAALLYTHYVPGLAVMAAAVFYLLPVRHRGWLAASMAGAVILYAPWLASLSSALSRWGEKTTYALSGSAGLEHVLKLGYWVVSFQAGETHWNWLLFTGLALCVPALALALAGARRKPEWLGMWAAAALVGYLGVARWVAYPFAPGRLLWLLPLYLVLIAAGIASRPRWGRAAGAALLACNAAGTAAYFARHDFLNKGYAIPYSEIAARIEEQRTAGSVRLVVDCCNADLPALEWHLTPGPPVERPESGKALDDLLRRIDADPPEQVWLLRNGHDVSPGKLNEKLERELARRYPSEHWRFAPYSAAERALMRLAGVTEQPDSFYLLARFGRL